MQGYLRNSVAKIARMASMRQSVGSVRNLNVHEYASMEILRKNDIAVPKTDFADSAEAAAQVYSKLFKEGDEAVLKAMVLTGGRGRGHFDNGLQSGVHFV